jgi:hypothetical protein
LPEENDEPSGISRAHSGHYSIYKHRSATKAWLIAIVSLAVLLAGTGVALALKGPKKHSGNSAHAHLTSPLAASSPGTPPSTSTATCPLTGLPAPGGAVPQRPALAIKVDDYPTARPQSGIENADIVFDEPVEALITRWVAVFQCQSSSLVGPVRSARAVDAQILDELSDPVFLHVGGIPPVISLINQANDYNEDLGDYPSITINPPDRYAPYDMYTSTDDAWGLVPNDTKPPAPIFTYSQNPSSGGKAVSSINIPYSGTNDATWTWSASAGQWFLSYSGEPATVDTGAQISTTNVVVETVHVTYGPWVEDPEGDLEVQSQLTGTGPLMVLRNGVEISGTWKRSQLDQATKLVASNGSNIPLQPGQTWVEIVPTSVPVTTTPVSTTASNNSGSGTSGQ